jgi:hypothetical protein
MQTSGDTPQTLAPDVGGVFDMLDMYTRDRMTGFLGNQQLINTAGVFNLGLVVPPGETYIVYGASLYANQTAATSGRYQLMLSIAAAGNAIYVPLGPATALAAGEQAYMGAMLPRPMLFRAGDLVLGQCQVYTGAANTGLIGNVLYSRLIGV